MTDIAGQVSAFIVENMLVGSQVDLARVPSLLEAGVIDSTGVLELVQFIEETWGIRVLDHEMVPANLDSLERIARFVEQKAPSVRAPASTTTAM